MVTRGLVNSKTFYHIITDMAGNYVYVNQHFKETFHFIAEDFIGKPSHNSYHPEDISRCLSIVEKCINHPGEAFSVNLRKPLPNDEYFWTTWEFSLLHDESGAMTGINCIGFDITEDRKNRDNLKNQEQLLTELSKQVPGALYQYLQKQDGSFTFLYVSTGTKEIYELAPKAIMENAYLPFERTHPADLERVIASIKEANETLTNWECDFRVNLPQKGTRWVRGSSKPEALPSGDILWHGFLTDITDIRNTYYQLEQSEKQNKAVLRAIPDLIFRFDKNYQFTYIRANDQSLLAAPAQSVIGKPFESFIPTPVADLAKQKIDDTIRDKNLSQLEYSLDVPNGKKHFEMRIVPFDKDEVLAIVRDVTERKKVEDALKTSERKFRELFELAPVGIFLTDTKEGKFLEMNKAFLESTQYNIDELERLGYQGITPEEYQQLDKEQGAKLMTTGKYGPFEKEYIKKDGERYPVQLNGIIVSGENGERKVLSIAKDMTDTKKEQQRLRLFESVITNANDSIIITDANPIFYPGPKIIYVNDAFTKMTGYSREEIIGKTPRVLQGPETDRATLDRLVIKMQKWEPYEIEIINYKKNGEKFWNSLSIVPVKDDKDWLKYWIAIERDVTERKKREIEKEQLIKELVLSNKELKQFSYITSHNLRAPITNLIGLINLAETIDIDNPEMQEIFDGFKISAQTLNETVNDLLRVLVIKNNQAIEQQELEFEKILKSITTQIRLSLEHSKAIIETDFSKGPVIHFNKSYLESIFLNLITNSIKYKSTTRQLHIKIVTQAEQDCIRLTYQDNGLGLDVKKLKPRIFGLYQRFHGNTDAKGLGLYLIKSQVEALGGSVDVDGQINKGLTFYFEFKGNPDDKAHTLRGR